MTSEPEPESESKYRIVRRSEWGAKTAKKVVPMGSPAIYVYCFNTFSRECKTEKECASLLRDMQEKQFTAPFYLSDIRFNFLINADSTIYEGRGWGIEPTLPANFRHFTDQSVLIGYIGYHTERSISSHVHYPRDELIEYGIENKFIAPNYELREILQMSRN